MRFHTQTAGVSLTAQQPLNNLTRVAIQALAAVLGGTQSLHTDAYDEAWAVPSADAALLALRQQQIIAAETGVDQHGRSARRLVVRRVADQRGRARRCGATSTRSTRCGGMVAAIAAGYPQKEIADAAYRFQREFDAGEREIVGVNVYADPDEELAIPLLEVSEESLRRHLGAPGADAARARRRGASRRPWRGLRDLAGAARARATRT